MSAIRNYTLSEERKTYVVAKKLEKTYHEVGTYFYGFLEVLPGIFSITKVFTDESQKILLNEDFFEAEDARRCWTALLKNGYERVR